MKSNRIKQTIPLLVNIMAARFHYGTRPTPQQKKTTPPEPVFDEFDVDHDHYSSRNGAWSSNTISRPTVQLIDGKQNGKLTENKFNKTGATMEGALSTNGPADDNVTTAKVKTKLLHKLKLFGLAIHVETHNGVVLLTGFLGTEEQKRIAASTALQIDGVKKVKNDLIVSKAG